MIDTRARPGMRLGQGAVAGVLGVVAFSIAHQAIINAIWWMLPVMAVVGAVCGMVLVWCYSALVDEPSVRSWLSHVATFAGLLVALGLASLLVYEPITTLDRVLLGEVPIGEAMPLTLAMSLLFALVLTVLHGKGAREFGVTLVSTVVFMVLLGLNVSTMGLVSLGSADWVLVAEFFALIGVLALTFGLSFLATGGLRTGSV